MRQRALEQLWEARLVASAARDLAEMVQCYLEQRDLVRHLSWLQRAEAMARRLALEARSLEDRLYAARYYLTQPPAE